MCSKSAFLVPNVVPTLVVVGGLNYQKLLLVLYTYICMCTICI